MKRLKMDRRRLECAHFRYAMLKVAQFYSDDLDINKLVFTFDSLDMLLEFTPLYQQLFYRKYSGIGICPISIISCNVDF